MRGKSPDTGVCSFLPSPSHPTKQQMAINPILVTQMLLVTQCLAGIFGIPLEIPDLEASPSELAEEMQEMQAVEEAMAAFLANGTNLEEATTTTTTSAIEQENVKPKRTIGNAIGYGYESYNSLTAQEIPQRYTSATPSSTPVRYYYTKSVESPSIAYAPSAAGPPAAAAYLPQPIYTAVPQPTAPLLPTAMPVIVVKVNEAGQVIGMHQASMTINVQQMVMNYLQNLLTTSPTILQPVQQQPESPPKQQHYSSPQQQQQHQQQQQSQHQPTLQASHSAYYGPFKSLRKPIDTQHASPSSPEYAYKYPK